MARRKFPPKSIRRKTMVERAIHMAQNSNPLLASLWLAHAKICEENQAARARPRKNAEPPSA